MPDAIRAAGAEYLRDGISIIPVGANKRPLGLWKRYQEALMAESDIPIRFHDKNTRIALVCGAVSGNLECIDFDDPDTFQPFLDLVEMRAPALLEKLRRHSTPSGGYHIIYRRLSPPLGNQIFARHMDGKVRIETRGEGGYFLAPPSEGYAVLSAPDIMEPLSDDECRVLEGAALSFNLKNTINMPPALTRATAGEDAPGTVFARENDIRDLLLKYGWKPCGTTTAGEGWTRPGKDTGVSGVLLSSTKNFYCWTSNAPPLDPCKSYSTFALHAQYEHDGDFSAAAKALKKAKKSTMDTPPQTEPHIPVVSRSVSEIMKTQYPPVRWVVPGIIPEGMTVLAGKPKLGKGWLMLGLCYAVATGGKAWGLVQVEKASAHYLTLEDSERRIQDRILQQAGHFNEHPDNMHIYTNFPRIGDVFFKELDTIIEKDPATGLVIIDTLQKIRPLTGGKRGSANIYQVEYEDYERIQKWSITNGVAVVCVHHTRKGSGLNKAADQNDEISGSRGLQGVADTLIVVDRARGSDEGLMKASGREISEEEYPMSFHRGTMTWELHPAEEPADIQPFLIASYFKDKDFITVEDAARIMVCNQWSARRWLDAAVDRRELDRNKMGKVTNYYIVKKEGG